ncbi:MAG: family 43 glycosylhydrolase [Bacteroidales bacterium]|nr:family 43 glycosylhydrolase [Bacteroidales bacterium]
MRRIILILSITTLASSVATAQNPIFLNKAYNSDPQARVWTIDGTPTLFVYGSKDENPSYYCSGRYDVFSTVDMIHWKGGQSFISEEIKYNDEVLYAPDCIEKNGKYYLFYSQPGHNPEGTAVADSPYGPFKDGKPVENANQIDPSVFIDDDGQAWMFWGQFSAKCAKLNPDMRSIDPSTIKDGIITEAEHHFHEGIQAFKHNGTYYLVFADISRRGMPTCLGYATSNSVTGPYTYRGVIIDNFGCDPAVWNNHGSVVKFRDQWYVFYHRSTQGSNTMRQSCVEPIDILPDGSIPEVEMTSTGAGKPLDPYLAIGSDPVAGRACYLTGHTRINGKGELEGIRDNDTAAWRDFDFQEGPRKMIISLRPKAGGVIDVYSEYLYGATVASFEVPEGDGKTIITLEAVIDNVPAGIHPIRMRFHGKEDHDLFTINAFRFQ